MSGAVSEARLATITRAAGAEHLVAADLSFAGYDCSMATAGLPYDLLVDLEGRLVRVQVKSTLTSGRTVKGAVRNGRRRPDRHHDVYSFQVRSRTQPTNHYEGQVDAFAFVAIDVRRVLYALPGDLPTILLVRPDQMSSDACAESRHRVFASL